MHQTVTKQGRTESVWLSNAGEAHLGSQAQPTGIHPLPPPLKTMLAGTAQLSLEMLQRTHARTEVTGIQIVQTGRHVRKVLPDMGTGLGTGMGTDITVTGSTKVTCTHGLGQQPIIL